MTHITNTTRAKEILTASWQTLIDNGDMTAEEMAESLQDQIDGYADMSLDELDPILADLMGMDIDDLTDEDLDTWRDLVNETAREWLAYNTSTEIQPTTETATIEEALVAGWEHYTEGEIPLTSDLLADLQDTYERLVADGSTIGEALMEAVYIVADAQ